MRGRFVIAGLIGLMLLVLGAIVLGCGGESTTTTTADSMEGTESETTATEGTETTQATESMEGGEEIVLKAVTAWPENIKDNAGLFSLRDKVNEAGKGKVRIEYLGGPEVIDTMEQPSALQSGTIDIAWLSAGYTASLNPVSNAVKLSKMSPAEERESGVTELWNQYFGEHVNARLLAKGSAPDVRFHIYTAKPIESMADFDGVPIRTTPAYFDFVTALGGSPVNMTPGDVYSALERGVVEGYGWPAYGISDFGWDELTEYVIDPGFYQVDCLGLINLDSWNKLPQDVQDIITQASIETETEMADHFRQIAEDDRAMITTDAGVEVIEYTGDEAQRYVDTAYQAVWDKVMQDVPEEGAAVKEALGQ